MRLYTVKQVAKMAGVSVRALHHYDAIGLLRPASTGENGYRYYGREELLRLQQILTWRELDLPLEAIGAMLDRPEGDRVAVLESQRAALAAKAARYRRLIRTLDATLADLRGEKQMDDKTIFDGYDREKQAAYEQELIDRYGEGARRNIDLSKANMAGWDQARKRAVQDEAEALHAECQRVLALNLPVDAPEVVAVIDRHYRWICNFWTPNAQAYRGLGEMYRDDPRFRAFYDGYDVKLAPYLAEAMSAYAAVRLS